MGKINYIDIDDYISKQDISKQHILKELRSFISQHSNGAVEKISWSMPTFYLNGNLIYFMANKKHIGLYPGVSGIEKFASEFDKLGLNYTKGAVQLPYDKPIPWKLIEKIMKFKVKNITKAKDGIKKCPFTMR